MAERKDRMALLSRYSKYHTARYESKPSLNLNVEQWASDALVESYTLPGCYDILEDYFLNPLTSIESNMYIYIPYKIYDNVECKYISKITDKGVEYED